MADIEFKAPTSQEEWDEMKKMLRSEINDDELDEVVGGNDDMKKKKKQGVPYTCPFCGAQMVIYAAQDACKHMTKCPNNPYK